MLAIFLMTGISFSSIMLGITGEEKDDLIAGNGDSPNRRLFLDALMIEEESNLERVFHSCEKYSGNPVIIADTPWESGGSGPYLYGTVMRDQGKFRMWYHFIRNGYRNAYAESDDGLHWVKPELGIIEFDGSNRNNLFITVTQNPDENPPRKARGQCHNPSVIKLPEEQKGYALFCYGADYDKVRVAFSPDGLNWDFVPETAQNGLFESSDVVNFFYDPYKKRYTATWKGGTRRGRSVGIATSGDGLYWEKPCNSPVFTADDLDPPATQIYGMPVFPYQGLYIGLPWIYHANVHYPPEMLLTREEAEAESPCTTDVQLAWSWDLINWTRPFPRKPFIANGSPGEFDSHMIYTATAPVLVGDKLYFYYGGFDCPHNARQFNGAIGIAKLRLDGFCSMRAGQEEGWLITRREKLAIPEVVINARTEQDGYIVAEILDSSLKRLERKESEKSLLSNVIPGFSVQDCVLFSGDDLRYKLRWKSASFPEGHKNTVKKIRFYLKKAELYSYALMDSH